MSEYYIGLISGTSMDGVDAALVEFSLSGIDVVCTKCVPYPEDTQRRLKQIIEKPDTVPLDELGELDTLVGGCFACAALYVLDQSGLKSSEITGIGSHGQNVRHRPDAHYPFSWQMGDPNVIATETRITTVADFRRRDVALGGQGAPLTPGFHGALFSTGDEYRVVLNIGGIANLTLLPKSGQITGFDTGPGNSLMDIWIHDHQGLAMDKGGVWAASGTVDLALLDLFKKDPYFDQAPPKSTGREYFNRLWLGHLLDTFDPAPEPADVQATLCELTAQSIADCVGKYAGAAERVLLCGGGAHNPYLMQRVAALMPKRTVETTAQYGLDPDWVEAAAFAWLARRTLRGETGNLCSVTGASAEAVLGAVFHA